MNYKKLTDEELVFSYKKLNKIIIVVDGVSMLNEKVLNKLPQLLIKHVNCHREYILEHRYIMSISADIEHEMKERFIKQHNKK